MKNSNFAAARCGAIRAFDKFPILGIIPRKQIGKGCDGEE
jgi:hypothetical protein